MKKFIVAILCLALCLSVFAGCGKKKDEKTIPSVLLPPPTLRSCRS